MAAAFHLHIADLDGLVYDGQAQMISCRTIDGEVAILARHINYISAISVGRAAVIMEDGSRREAACVGGMLTMVDNYCRMICNTWEWTEEINVERAKEALKRAEKRLADPASTEKTRLAAQLKKKRAELRLQLTGNK